MTEPGRKWMFSVSREKPKSTARPVSASTLASWMESGRIPIRPAPLSPPSRRML